MHAATEKDTSELTSAESTPKQQAMKAFRDGLCASASSVAARSNGTAQRRTDDRFARQNLVVWWRSLNQQVSHAMNARRERCVPMQQAAHCDSNVKEGNSTGQKVSHRAAGGSLQRCIGTASTLVSCCEYQDHDAGKARAK